MSSASSEDEKERLLKIVVCGDGSSGKTSLCLRFAHDSFDGDYHQTLGLDFFSRRVLLIGDIAATIQVWDIGGQSMASAMIEKYVFGADAILIVYDITNASSFDDVNEWVITIKRLLKHAETFPVMVLVGNKADMEVKRVVKMEKHVAMAQEHDMRYFHTSARTGDSVNLLFKQVAADVLKVVLPKSEMDKDINVPMVAEASLAVDQPKRRAQSQNNTTVCSMM